MLTAHIIVALASLVLTAMTFFQPSRLKLRLSQILITATLASGTFLVLTMHVNLLRVCSVGLIYTAVVVFGIVSIQRRLAAEREISKLD